MEEWKSLLAAGPSTANGTHRPKHLSARKLFRNAAEEDDRVNRFEGLSSLGGFRIARALSSLPTLPCKMNLRPRVAVSHFDFFLSRFCFVFVVSSQLSVNPYNCLSVLCFSPKNFIQRMLNFMCYRPYSNS